MMSIDNIWTVEELNSALSERPELVPQTQARAVPSQSSVLLESGGKILPQAATSLVPGQGYFGGPTKLSLAQNLNFSFQKFDDTIRAHCQKYAYNWVYGISHFYQPCTFGASGFAQLPPDITEKDILNTVLSAWKHLDLMSMSKTVTAVAMLKFFAENGISLDAPLGQWYPWYWNTGAFASKITPRMLMSHTSGIPDAVSTDSTQEIRERLAKGCAWDPTVVNKTVYTNWNFAILRILMLTIASNQFIPEDDNGVEQSAGKLLADYIRTNVLAPAGINSALWGPSGKIQWPPKRYFYPPTFDVPGKGPASPLDNYENRAGAGSLYLPVADYLKFLIAMDTAKIISGQNLKEMRLSNLGCFSGTLKNNQLGRFFTHNGGLPEATARWMGFPLTGTHVVIISTCGDANMMSVNNLYNLMVGAYESAWSAV